jgi:hypothetical protein
MKVAVDLVFDNRGVLAVNDEKSFFHYDVIDFVPEPGKRVAYGILADSQRPGTNYRQINLPRANYKCLFDFRKQYVAGNRRLGSRSKQSVVTTRIDAMRASMRQNQQCRWFLTTRVVTMD